MVHSLNPDFVITVGNNNYPTGQASTLDTNVGQYYHDFIYPYKGSYGAGSPTGSNRFFPTLGGHDWGDAYPNPAGAQPYLDYFGLPGNGHDSTFGTPVPGSQVRYAGDFGAMLVDAQADHLTFQFIGAWDHAGQVIDSYTLYAQPAAHLPDPPSGLTASAVAPGQV